MDCHESARAPVERPAVVTCRYCSFGLCKKHLVEMHRSPGKPLYTCLHRHERGFDTLNPDWMGSPSPVSHRAV